MAALPAPHAPAVKTVLAYPATAFVVLLPVMGAPLTGDRFLALAALIAATPPALYVSAPYRHRRSTR